MSKSENIYQSITFRLYPTLEQEILFNKTVGCCRYVYNRYLAQKIKYYEEKGKTLSTYRCSRRLTILKTKHDHAWLKDVDHCALQQSLKDMNAAFTNFFKHGFSFPKFHKKGMKEAFRLVQTLYTDLDNRLIRLSKCGWVNARGSWNRIPQGKGDKLQSITVKKENNGKFYAILLFKLAKPRKLPKAELPLVAVDLGVKRPLQVYYKDAKGKGKFFVLGRKEKKYLEKIEHRRKRAQRKLARTQRNSKNREKARRKVAKLFWREKQIRNNFAHQTSHKLTSQFRNIKFEDLNLKGMTKKGGSHKTGLNREMLRIGLGSIVSLCEQKAKVRKGKVSYVNPKFTSQTCSACGHRDKASRNQSNFCCISCDYQQNADKNAAKNIFRKAA